MRKLEEFENRILNEKPNFQLEREILDDLIEAEEENARLRRQVEDLQGKKAAIKVGSKTRKGSDA